MMAPSIAGRRDVAGCKASLPLHTEFCSSVALHAEANNPVAEPCKGSSPVAESNRGKEGVGKPRRKIVSPSHWMRESQRKGRENQHTAMGSPSHALALASLKSNNQVKILRDYHSKVIELKTHTTNVDKDSAAAAEAGITAHEDASPNRDGHNRSFGDGRDESELATSPQDGHTSSSFFRCASQGSPTPMTPIPHLHLSTSNFTWSGHKDPLERAANTPSFHATGKHLALSPHCKSSPLKLAKQLTSSANKGSSLRERVRRLRLAGVRDGKPSGKNTTSAGVQDLKESVAAKVVCQHDCPSGPAPKADLAKPYRSPLPNDSRSRVTNHTDSSKSAMQQMGVIFTPSPESSKLRLLSSAYTHPLVNVSEISITSLLSVPQELVKRKRASVSPDSSRASGFSGALSARNRTPSTIASILTVPQEVITRRSCSPLVERSSRSSIGQDGSPSVGRPSRASAEDHATPKDTSASRSRKCVSQNNSRRRAECGIVEMEGGRGSVDSGAQSRRLVTPENDNITNHQAMGEREGDGECVEDDGRAGEARLSGESRKSVRIDERDNPLGLSLSLRRASSPDETIVQPNKGSQMEVVDSLVQPEMDGESEKEINFLSPILQSLGMLQRALSPYSAPIQLGSQHSKGSMSFFDMLQGNPTPTRSLQGMVEHKKGSPMQFPIEARRLPINKSHCASMQASIMESESEGEAKKSPSTSVRTPFAESGGAGDVHAVGFTPKKNSARSSSRTPQGASDGERKMRSLTEGCSVDVSAVEATPRFVGRSMRSFREGCTADVLATPKYSPCNVDEMTWAEFQSTESLRKLRVLREDVRDKLGAIVHCLEMTESQLDGLATPRQVTQDFNKRVKIQDDPAYDALNDMSRWC